MPEIGMIQEQGDLGLGWTPVSEEEEAILKKEQNKNNEKDEKETGAK